MTTWNRLRRGILLTGAVAAIVTGASAGAAVAVDSTFTITPGGTITLTSPSIVLQDGATGTTLTCTSSTGSGGLNGPTSPPDGILGTITALTFTGCTGPQGQPFTIKLDRFPFYLGGKTYNATTGVTHGIIYKAHGELSGPACTATLTGPLISGGGIRAARFRFTYANSSGKLKVLADKGFLFISNVSGCAGLFNSGATPDPASLTGAYTVSPKQTITSP
jgi:hypothetical protein